MRGPRGTRTAPNLEGGVCVESLDGNPKLRTVTVVGCGTRNKAE